MTAGVCNKIDEAARRMYDRLEDLPGVEGCLTFVVGDKGTHVHSHISGRPDRVEMLVRFHNWVFAELESAADQGEGFKVRDLSN